MAPNGAMKVKEKLLTFLVKIRYIVRFQGGANAGHTLKFDDKEVVLHLIIEYLMEMGFVL